MPPTASRSLPRATPSPSPRLGPGTGTGTGSSRSLHTTAGPARARQPDPTGGNQWWTSTIGALGTRRSLTGKGRRSGRGGDERNLERNFYFTACSNLLDIFIAQYLLSPFIISVIKYTRQNFSELFPYLVSRRQTSHRSIHGSEAPKSQWLPPR